MRFDAERSAKRELLQLSSTLILLFVCLSGANAQTSNQTKISANDKGEEVLDGKITLPEINSLCGPIFFPLNSARVNNEHKACLDEISLQLQQDPRSTVAIDGHRDSAERVGISLTRANNARDYLVSEKGVDAARITVRNFGDSCAHESGDTSLNRRVEFWGIPANGSADNIPKRCFEGGSGQVITSEEPAVVDEKRKEARMQPRRPPRRRARRRR